ncbi:hypothetical protein EPUL_003794 [Erysiphe pulchra]|uniref:Six-hairpin glycosidase n=1 Tax=Erysiphe pulchra TaxID=225359 RepID=A0A2S4PUR0_9PEZI|nr:hypothetical protein EPUL_003794 [Erysiphe pulchra]
MRLNGMIWLQLVIITVINKLLGIVGAVQCPDYASYSQAPHEPLSGGRYNLPYMRPQPLCRSFNSSDLEDIIIDMKNVIKDPDLYRLFENCFPNSLDTAVKWRGTAANNSKEELAFLITGDINAMWLRDSANQMQSYRSFLKASSSSDSLASLYRGVINLQARYINLAPFCNSFQPPVESGLAPTKNQDNPNNVNPPYNADQVFECKYELDSLAAFLEISTNYFEATKDTQFFKDFQWVSAVKTIITTTELLMEGTYASDGSVNKCPYTWNQQSTSGSETLTNGGCGNPVKGDIGLVRSAFRPSDDATIFQFFIPANMMFAGYLSSASKIMAILGTENELADHMNQLSLTIRTAITKYAIVRDATYGDVYAYEVDGFGSINRMDDANIPSLLSAPIIRYSNISDTIYQNTRRYVLSEDNPYFMRGPIINAVGGPHVGPGMAWPMASIVRILTSDDEKEITTALKEIVSSTAGLGLIHESINSFNESRWTRQWFSWANGLLGECLLDLKARKAEILGQSFQ